MKKLVSFMRDEKAATAIEYGLIAGLIAVALVAILGTVGTDLYDVFNNIAGELETVAENGGGDK